MPNKKTIAVTQAQYHEIIDALRTGLGCRPNDRVATVLILEANLGLRISDVLRLRLMDIVRDGFRYRLEIREKKTKKARTFTVPAEIYLFIENYCLRHSIGSDERIFPITERTVQKQLKLVCDFLGLKGISTHSFRKFFATEIYKNNGFNIALVQQLLQHSSPAVTQKYIGISTQEVEKALRDHIELP